MVMKPILMDEEMEYSMSAAPESGGNRRGEFHNLMLDAIRGQHAWLPDVRTPTGIYLENGSRYYLDSGYHNEFSSPEVASPREIAIYDRASEQILLAAKAAVKKKTGDVDICVTKNNVNFSMPDRAAWGQHEAYMCWVPLPSAAQQLIPHLVSRISYAGAGCLSGHAKGMGFELSQRARHMTRLTGRETTHHRAIFCTRAWKPSDMSEDGWTRTNLICKDSQRCSFGMYLSYGVTALLMMMVNQGHRLGADVQLKDAVSAMRLFSLDPHLKVKVPLADGKRATAIDIQRRYHAHAKQYLESENYPEWAYEAFEHWTQTLDQLESDPRQLENRLDTYLKLRMFDRQLERHQCSWKQLQTALGQLDKLRGAAPEQVVRALLNETSQGLESDHQALYEKLAKKRDYRGGNLEMLRFALRMQALELNYHELGGLFDRMLATGYIDSVVVTPEKVRHALGNPPSGGRAEQRSQSIQQVQGNAGWACDWEYVINEADQRWYDLRDPFVQQSKVTPIADEFSRRRRRRSHIEDLMFRIAE